MKPPKLSISGRVRRSMTTEDRVQVIEIPPSTNGKPVDTELVLTGYLDLLYWMQRESSTGHGRLLLPDDVAKPALDALATLEDERRPSFTIEVRRDGEPYALVCPDFSASGCDWAKQLADRQRASMPTHVEQLCEAVADPRFAVYRNLGDDNWFGKVEGLRLCTFDNGGPGGVLRVGSEVELDGKELKATRVGFRAAVGADELRFAPDPSPRTISVAEAAKAVERLIESRAGGCLAGIYREGRLEARVLRSKASVEIDGIGKLAVATKWGQFPTLWSSTGSCRELDVLMQHGERPWAVELKHHEPAGVVSYYRHAVGQAALYGAFIRRALPLHGWFTREGMIAAECRAAVAITEKPSYLAWEARLDEVRLLASLFEVEVVVLPASSAA